MKFYGVIRRIHLWAGVLLGVQVILWMLSGVVMSWYHIDLVRGERNAPVEASPELEVTAYASPGGVIAQSEGAYTVELRTYLGRPVYEVNGVTGNAIFDAKSGEALSPIAERDARKIARNGFVGAGEIDTLELVDDPGLEMRGNGPRPIWRAQFNDRLNTRIYISPETGEIVRRRNDVWRLYDFFWMLHIMDYVERDNFNNPIVRAVSAAGLIFSVSGFVMLFFRRSWKTLGEDLKTVTGRKK